MATFAERLRELKEENGLTIEQMAEKIGCSASGLRAWLYRDREPTLISLFKVSTAFDVRMSWLLGTDEIKGINQEIRLDCFICGGEKTVVGARSVYNGHFHGVCENCGARVYE